MKDEAPDGQTPPLYVPPHIQRIVIIGLIASTSRANLTRRVPHHTCMSLPNSFIVSSHFNGSMCFHKTDNI